MANVDNFQTGSELPNSILLVRLRADNRRKDSVIATKNRQIEMLIQQITSKN